MQGAQLGSGGGGSGDVARRQQRALGVAALAAGATILWLVWPVGLGVLLGLFLAFIVRPVYERLARRWPPAAAALVTVLGTALTIALTFSVVVTIFVRDGSILGRKAIDALGPNGGAQKISLHVTALTSRLGLSSTELQAKARTAIEGATSSVAGVAESIASITASTMLGLFFEMLTMYFVLRRWDAVITTAQDLLPLRPDYTLKLLAEFRRIGRTTLLSTVFIGLVQGALATIGYWIVGLPQPLFFGALTTVASLVPALGSTLVWVPASVVLAVLGHVWLGIFLALWGVLVLSGIPDYVIRPRLVGSGSGEVPALITFIGLLGGTAVLGLKGLILGPVLMTMAIAILRIYSDEERVRKNVTCPEGDVDPMKPSGARS
jgi:predicted PurR-regulated permease PerM